MPTLALAPQDLEHLVGTLVSVLEIHMDTLLPKAFIESLVLPRALVRHRVRRSPGSIFPQLRLLLEKLGECPHTWQPCVPYAWRKLLSWAQGVRWRVLKHVRSGHLQFRLLESSKYWGLRAKRQSAGVSGGSGQTLRHLASEGKGEFFSRGVGQCAED